MIQSKELKQTTIEWLEENMPDLSMYIPLGVSIQLHARFQQAKEMEKVMLWETFYSGQESMEEGGKGFDQFYNDKYLSNE